VLLGVESLPGGKRKAHLWASVERVFAERFSGRILLFDEDAARSYAKIVQQREQLDVPFHNLTR
jgi:hypothetical protein